MSKRLSLLRKNFKIHGMMWPENYVLESLKHFPSDYLLRKYFELLDKKCSENIIHEFLKRNPIILSAHICRKNESWVFSKPRFGCEYIPDFLLCTVDSAGYHWTLVELEAPAKKSLRKDGQQTAHISTAIKQINEWRIWIRNNISYAQDELELIDINAECKAVIVIGRRNNIPTEFRELYNELSKDNLIIMSYDRLGFKI